MRGIVWSERCRMRTSGEIGVPREGALCEAVEVLCGLVAHDADEYSDAIMVLGWWCQGRA